MAKDDKANECDMSRSFAESGRIVTSDGASVTSDDDGLDTEAELGTFGISLSGILSQEKEGSKSKVTLGVLPPGVLAPLGVLPPGVFRPPLKTLGVCSMQELVCRGLPGKQVVRRCDSMFGRDLLLIGKVSPSSESMQSCRSK